MKQGKTHVRNKKSIIEISLVSESIEPKNDQIWEDIINELSESAIPWCKQIERVIVKEK